jgi:hypothetical protein
MEVVGDLPLQPAASTWQGAVCSPVVEWRGDDRSFAVTRGNAHISVVPSVHAVPRMFSRRWREVVFAVC